jgi:hypothetical protein
VAVKELMAAVRVVVVGRTTKEVTVGGVDHLAYSVVLPAMEKIALGA